MDAKAQGIVGENSRHERQRATVEGQADQSRPSEWSREEKAGREERREAGGGEAGFIAHDSQAGTVQIPLIPRTSSQARHY